MEEDEDLDEAELKSRNGKSNHVGKQIYDKKLPLRRRINKKTLNVICHFEARNLIIVTFSIQNKEEK
jgi:hypothetical protein